jgi:hypothetical protein
MVNRFRFDRNPDTNHPTPTNAVAATTEWRRLGM